MLYSVCHGYFARLDIKSILAYGGGGRQPWLSSHHQHQEQTWLLSLIIRLDVFLHVCSSSDVCLRCTMRARCHEGSALSQDHKPAH